MRRLRPALRAYVLTVIVAGIAAFAVAAATWTEVGADAALLALVLFVIAAVAQAFPVHLSVKVKVTAEDTATFAAALLLGPALAMLVAGGATLVGLRFRTGGSRWYNRAFNTAVAALGTGGAAAVYRVLGGADAPDLAHPVPIAVSAAVKYLIDSLVVANAVDLQLKRRPLTSWWSTQRRDLPQYASLYLLGALAATSSRGEPWVFLLFAVPMALVFLTLRETARVREQTRMVVLELADLIDLRDPYTHGHSQRVAALAERLARRLRLEPAQVELVRDAARVHDIGKIGTNDLVLQKPGPLTEAEREEMERHAELGHRLLRRLPEFWEGAELVLAHHERVDGRGYPRRLVGDEVPIEASVIAVCDTYDAMTTDRPYRAALPWPQVRGELLRERGRQWHARTVDAFLAMMDEQHFAAERPTVRPDARGEPAGAVRLA